MDQPKDDPGKVGTIKFPVFASVLLLIAVVILTIVFHLCNKWRDTMTFGIGAGALAAGALGAYYLGRGLSETIRQRSESISEQKTARSEQKIARAFEFHRRWNDPALAQTKAIFREIIESGRAHVAEAVEQLIQNDRAKRNAVVEILNFFEELAIAVHTGVADNDTLYRGFRGPLREYHATLRQWIEQHRSSKKRSTMWEELEKLVNEWNR
jgi:hypothetical protein